MNKKIIQLALITVFFSTNCYPVFAFKDLDVSSPYTEAIEYLTETDSIQKNDNFYPEKNIKRAEFIKIALTDNGVNLSPSNAALFSDTETNAWYNKYLNTAVETNLINPDILGKVYPDQEVSRIDAIMILTRLNGIPAPFASPLATTLYKDIDKGYPKKHYIIAALESGLLANFPTDYFSPQKSLTRAEAAELIYRAGLYNQGKADAHSLIPYEGYLSNDELSLLKNEKFSLMLDIWGRINTRYLHKEDINEDALIYGAINGMVESLGDQYSNFKPPSIASDPTDSEDGSYEGIGAIIEKFQEDFLVISVIKESPAQKSGLQAGDIIKKVDNKDVTNLTDTDLLNLLKGKADTIVKLNIEREGKQLELQITRGAIDLNLFEDIETDVTIPEDIAYIAIYHFGENTNQEFEEVLAEKLKKNPKGIILDLRNNPGGYVESAYQILNHFEKKGEIMANIKRDGTIEAKKSKGEGELTNIPTVVVVNKNTASAAEIVAGALQDQKIATLVGETTFGKGTVQEVTEYTDASTFKLSIAQWLTPLKRDINHIGLTPEVEVLTTKEDVLGKTDTQLKKAISELQAKFSQ